MMKNIRGPDELKSIDHIGADLWRAFRNYERAMFDRVAREGYEDISLADSDILVFVGAKGARPANIAIWRRVTKQSVNEQVHSLIKRGYLVMESDPDDKRAKIVRYTKKGIAMARALQKVKHTLNEEVLSFLGATKLDALSKMLGAIERYQFK
jgi:DNA-binding MarR family transcriptional regulator